MRCVPCGNTSHAQGATTCRVCGTALPAGGPRSSARDSTHYRDLSQQKRHLLVRVGAPPIELREGVEVRVGRSRECDVVIQSPRVSRVHALLLWQEAAPAVRDLASQNGVWVNGAQVREARLDDGDELTIGPFACTYRRIDAIGSMAELQALLDSQADTQEVEATAMSGRLAEVKLYEVLETLAALGRSGTVEVFGPWGDEGRVGVLEGQPVWASLGDLAGRAALEALLEWTEGHFRFSRAVEARPRDVQASLEEVLDGLRRRDGERRPPDGRSAHGLSAADYGA
ncbi:MAG: FHA domain-containing protein [Planctomycetes bacterium]|nr:FHA domain-containing protein [Planctomycetota bacterium]